MQQRIGKLMAAAALAALAGQLWAGGFWLQLGNPEANTEARKANAALVIKAVGCHDPAGAHVSARAVGTVDGKRQVIPLKLTALSEPGTYRTGAAVAGTGKVGDRAGRQKRGTVHQHPGEREPVGDRPAACQGG